MLRFNSDVRLTGGGIASVREVRRFGFTCLGGGGLEGLSKSKVVFPFSVCLRKASSRNSMLSNTFRPRIPNLSNPNSADPRNPRIPRPSSPILTCGDLGRTILFCAKCGQHFKILNLYFARSAEKILRFFQHVSPPRVPEQVRAY